MGCFEAQGKFAILGPVERRAEADQPVDEARPLGGDAQGDVWLGEPGAGHAGIGRVERGRIVGTHGGGDAALGPARGGAEAKG